MAALSLLAHATSRLPRCCFQPGPGGLTALHLAAVLPDGAPAGIELLAAAPAQALHAWFDRQAVDGCSPAQYASQAGNRHLTDHVLLALALDLPTVEALPGAGMPGMAGRPAGSGSGSGPGTGTGLGDEEAGTNMLSSSSTAERGGCPWGMAAAQDGGSSCNGSGEGPGSGLRMMVRPAPPSAAAPVLAAVAGSGGRGGAGEECDGQLGPAAADATDNIGAPSSSELLPLGNVTVIGLQVRGATPPSCRTWKTASMAQCSTALACCWGGGPRAPPTGPGARALTASVSHTVTHMHARAHAHTRPCAQQTGQAASTR